MKIYHGSYNENLIFDKSFMQCNSVFDEFIFFAEEAAANSHGNYLYSLEINDKNYLESSCLFDYEKNDEVIKLIKEFCEYIGCNSELAEDLLTENKNVYDFYIHEKDRYDYRYNVTVENVADMSFITQKYIAKIAKALGFEGAKVFDEHGTVYMVDFSKVILTKEF